jgi:hypothetical protein
MNKIVQIGGVFVGILLSLRGLFYIYLDSGEKPPSCRRGCEIENFIYMVFSKEVAPIIYGMGWIIIGTSLIYSAIRLNKPK